MSKDDAASASRPVFRSEQSVAKPARATRRVRLRWLLVLLLSATSAAGILWLRQRTVQVPEVPAVNFDGADPQLVAYVSSAQEAAGAAPHSAEVWGRLAMVCHANGYSQAALQAYETAAVLDPDTWQWPYLAGYLHMDGPGGPVAALPLFQRAATTSPPHSMAHVRLADALLELDQLDEAEQLYRRLLADEKAAPFANLGLARLLVVRGKLPEALQHLSAVADHPAVQQQACLVRTSTLDRMGDHVAAQRERARLAELAGDRFRLDDPVVQVLDLEIGVGHELRLAEAQFHAGNMAEGRQSLRRTVERYPQSVEAWEALAQWSSASGDWPGAEQATRKCIALAPKSAEHHLALGQLLLALRRHADAARALQQAIALDPQSGWAHLALGECREKLGDRAGAEAAYRQALLLLPDDPDVRRRVELQLANP